MVEKKKSLPKCYFPSKNLYFEQKSVLLDMNLWQCFFISGDTLWGSGPHLKGQDLLSPGDGSTADSCHTNSSPRLLFGDQMSLTLHIGIKSGSRMCSERDLIPWGWVMGPLPHDVDPGHPLDHSLCPSQQTQSACCLLACYN